MSEIDKDSLIFKKICVEQDKGETLEFDENAVNMLHLIASNRGQREERTLEEKLKDIDEKESLGEKLTYPKIFSYKKIDLMKVQKKIRIRQKKRKNGFIMSDLLSMR